MSLSNENRGLIGWLKDNSYSIMLGVLFIAFQIGIYAVKLDSLEAGIGNLKKEFKEEFEHNRAEIADLEGKIESNRTEIEQINRSRAADITEIKTLLIGLSQDIKELKDQVN